MTDDEFMDFLDAQRRSRPPRNMDVELAKLAAKVKDTWLSAYMLGASLQGPYEKFEIGDIRRSLLKAFTDRDSSFGKHTRDESIDELTAFLAAAIGWGCFEAAK